MGSVLIIFLVALTLFGGFLGLIRGQKRALFRLILILLSAVAGFIAMSYVSKLTPDSLIAILDSFSLNTPEIEEALTMVHISPSMLSLVCGMLRPIIFFSVFFLSSIVFLLVFWIGQFFIRYKKKSKKAKLGFLIGCLQGLLVALLILTPFVGYLGLVNDAAVAYMEKAPEGDALAETFEELTTTVAPITEGAAFGAVKSVTSPLFNIMITFDIQGEKANLQAEMGHVLSAYDLLGSLSGEGDGFTSEQVNAFHGIAGILEESTLFPAIMAEVFSAMGEGWQNGEAVMGMEPPSLGENSGELAEALYAFFATTTKDTIPSDIDTTATLIEIMVENGMFEENADISPAVADELLAVLDANPRTALLKEALVSLTVKTVVAGLGDTVQEVLTENEELVNVAVDSLQELAALPEAEREQKLEEMADSLMAELEKEGVSEEEIPTELIKEISTELADTLLEEVKDLEPSEITPDKIAEILVSLGASVNTSSIPQ